MDKELITPQPKVKTPPQKAKGDDPKSPTMITKQTITGMLRSKGGLAKLIKKYPDLKRKLTELFGPVTDLPLDQSGRHGSSQRKDSQHGKVIANAAEQIMALLKAHGGVRKDVFGVGPVSAGGGGGGSRSESLKFNLAGKMISGAKDETDVAKQLEEEFSEHQKHGVSSSSMSGVTGPPTKQQQSTSANTDEVDNGQVQTSRMVAAAEKEAKKAKKALVTADTPTQPQQEQKQRGNEEGKGNVPDGNPPTPDMPMSGGASASPGNIGSGTRPPPAPATPPTTTTPTTTPPTCGPTDPDPGANPDLAAAPAQTRGANSEFPGVDGKTQAGVLGYMQETIKAVPKFAEEIAKASDKGNVGGDQILDVKTNDSSEGNLRSEWGMEKVGDVIPSTRKQLESDIRFDMFDNVNPGFGEGMDNKLFLMQQARDKKIVYTGSMFEPGAYIGPISGTEVPSWKMQRVMQPAKVSAHEAEKQKRLQLASALLKQNGVKSSNVLGDDIGFPLPYSACELKRNPMSPFEPIIRTDMPWEAVKDPTGFKLNGKRFRSEFDAQRYPRHLQSSIAGWGGPIYPKRRALEVILH